jgi:DNA repair protein RadD
MICPDCGYRFPEKEKHEEKASDAEILSTWKKPKEVEVVKVTYNRHKKKGKPDSMRVDYYYDICNKYSVWICLDHSNPFAKKKALQWIKNVTESDVRIKNVDELLEKKYLFKKPEKIIVNLNKDPVEITGYIFPEKQGTLFDEKVLEKIIF